MYHILYTPIVTCVNIINNIDCCKNLVPFKSKNYTVLTVPAFPRLPTTL